MTCRIPQARPAIRSVFGVHVTVEVMVVGSSLLNRRRGTPPIMCSPSSTTRRPSTPLRWRLVRLPTMGQVVVMNAEGEARVTEMDVSMRDGSGTGVAKVEVTSRDESVVLVVISLAEVHGSSQHSGYRVRIDREEKVGELDVKATCGT